MGERPSLREIERRSGIRRAPDETVNEYFQREAFRSFADESEITAIRDAIQRRQFDRSATRSEGERAAIERFYEGLADYEATTAEPETSGTVGTEGTDEPRSDPEAPDAVIGTPPASEPSRDPSSAAEAPVAEGPAGAGTEQVRSTPGSRRRTGVAATVRERYGQLRRRALREPRRTRALFLVLVVLFAIPTGIANVTSSPAGASGASGAAGAAGTVDGNVTFVSAQGTETGFGPGIFAYDDDGDLVWSHNDYFRKYFDVDPIGDDRVLFIAQKHRFSNESAGYPWVAAIYDWRTDTLVREFPVPPVAHDVDYMGGDTYIVANMQSYVWPHHDDFLRVAKQRGWIDEDRETFTHNVYQLNLSTGEIEWEYQFEEHFPPSAGTGTQEDYTYLNDVDVVDNGSAILASPRNFDRVVLIDKETKELRWTLGEEDNYDVLYEQHNPVLLRLDPPTVLVADSENRRVVEYQRLGNGTWARTWVFGPEDLAGNPGFETDDLQWPRDADRLPNGTP